MSTESDRAWEFEEELLRSDVRADAKRLDALLAPGFREIGQSGRLWSRPEVIDALAQEEPGLTPGDLTERHAEDLAGGHVLLTYRLQVGDRASRRSSLWQITGYGTWLVFHQGTPILPDA